MMNQLKLHQKHLKVDGLSQPLTLSFHQRIMKNFNYIEQHQHKRTLKLIHQPTPTQRLFHTLLEIIHGTIPILINPIEPAGMTNQLKLHQKHLKVDGLNQPLILLFHQRIMKNFKYKEVLYKKARKLTHQSTPTQKSSHTSSETILGTIPISTNQTELHGMMSQPKLLQKHPKEDGLSQPPMSSFHQKTTKNDHTHV